MSRYRAVEHPTLTPTWAILVASPVQPLLAALRRLREPPPDDGARPIEVWAGTGAYSAVVSDADEHETDGWSVVQLARALSRRVPGPVYAIIGTEHFSGLRYVFERGKPKEDEPTYYEPSPSAFAESLGCVFPVKPHTRVDASRRSKTILLARSGALPPDLEGASGVIGLATEERTLDDGARVTVIRRTVEDRGFSLQDALDVSKALGPVHLYVVRGRRSRDRTGTSHLTVTLCRNGDEVDYDDDDASSTPTSTSEERLRELGVSWDDLI